ncbi:MAG: hypothetical protein ACI3XH_04540 [Phascolarctobacterium sp.]
MTRMEKLHDKISTYKGKTLNGLTLFLGLTVLAWTVAAVVMPKCEEGQGLWRQRQQQKLKLERLLDFAARHADYAAYEEARFRELVKLKEGVQQATDSNQLQQLLQLGAAKNKLLVKNMQVVPGNDGRIASKAEGKIPAPQAQASLGMTSVQLKLELVGDYFALLRWLKQVEKQRVAIQKIEIKGQGMGLVSANLVVRCFVMNAK